MLIPEHGRGRLRASAGSPGGASRPTHSAWAMAAACVLLVAGLLATGLVGGCGGEQAAAPRNGSEQESEVRMAVLSPALAVMLHDLGLEDHIVARHGWDLALDRSLPVAGDQTGLDYEVLLRVNPTHVLLEWGARPLPARLEELSARRGWSIQNHRLLTLEDVQNTTRELHERFAPAEETWEDTALARRMAAAFTKQPALEGAGRILLLYSVRPPTALGPGSAHQQVLESIGGVPALTNGSPFITMDLEDVLRLAPDGIILIGTGAGGEQDDAGRFGRIAALPIPAARRGRLAMIDHPLSQLPSTSLIEVAEQMARVLEQWAGE
jgi:ABC-type hemin transport system substrate-binding protein